MYNCDDQARLDIFLHSSNNDISHIYTCTFNHVAHGNCFFFHAGLVEVADFQITYSTSGNQTKKGVPRLVFRKNRTKIWVGGSTVPPKDRPKCGFDNELCPPPTVKPSGLFRMYFLIELGYTQKEITVCFKI